MSRVTSKLQITIPRAIAKRHSIEPGADLVFEDAGEAIRLVPAGKQLADRQPDLEERLELFDEATRRQRTRDESVLSRLSGTGPDRGWSREDLYERAIPR